MRRIMMAAFAALFASGTLQGAFAQENVANEQNAFPYTFTVPLTEQMSMHKIIQALMDLSGTSSGSVMISLATNWKIAEEHSLTIVVKGKLVELADEGHKSRSPFVYTDCFGIQFDPFAPDSYSEFSVTATEACMEGYNKNRMESFFMEVQLVTATHLLPNLLPNK